MTSTNHSSQHRSSSQIRDEAKQWFVALLQAPSVSKQREFEEWLRADPAHFDAYQVVETAWHAAEKPGQRLAQEEADELAGYVRIIDRNKRDRKSLRRLSVLSIFLAFLLGGVIWLERPGLLEDLSADYVTARAERQHITLADGSVVLLDADSALMESHSSTERRVSLLRGGAFFDVKPSQTPFVVEAANGEVSVLGTGFDVRIVEEGVVVTLEHGRVSVRTGEDTVPTILAPGQQVRFGSNGVGAVQNVDLEDALAWRGGRYTFYRARLGDVVREIQRYRKGRIVIATSTLGEERVTGSFSLADTDAALSSLQASVGFRMNTLFGRMTVIGP
ncbi:FecR family protein [Rhizobium nepotum]|uniref:Fe2+-dicitrate sensor, membrane component n=1 Tax=Rhizobium nepotum 39/7 TaxID=1368418 RepID=A0ABR5CRL8_9HYPH|nr:FecR domain-containing protein [Rhizobium nepotum]KJF67498.1 Fe2+-dicitrate sensor, membrane component [Rhizobium nepotum 39/7]